MARSRGAACLRGGRGDGRCNLKYDEVALSDRLAQLSEDAVSVFAACCAERLMPVYKWTASVTAREEVAHVRSALEIGWSESASPERVQQARADVEALVPDADDEDSGYTDVALAQNAIACVGYALRARLSHNVQDAVWAARQLYEAADYLVQLSAPNQTYIENVDEQAPVQLVLRGLATTIEDLGNGAKGKAKAHARSDGEALTSLFNQQ